MHVPPGGVGAVKLVQLTPISCGYVANNCQLPQERRRVGRSDPDVARSGDAHAFSITDNKDERRGCGGPCVNARAVIVQSADHTARVTPADRPAHNIQLSARRTRSNPNVTVFPNSKAASPANLQVHEQRSGVRRGIRHVQLQGGRRAGGVPSLGDVQRRSSRGARQSLGCEGNRTGGRVRIASARSAELRGNRVEGDNLERCHEGLRQTGKYERPLSDSTVWGTL